ncbi:MAG: DUF2309 domain-containing protein [Flavobacteriales bacterium]|nr:DUF2309 domain-containing protein [Flavobacteriales bacterium]
MNKHELVWDESHLIHLLQHYLPSQAPLKDFIHHNTLHGFQQEEFFDALGHAKHVFGYKTSLSLDRYRKFYKDGKINPYQLERSMESFNQKKGTDFTLDSVLHGSAKLTIKPTVGQLRSKWKQLYQVDLNALTHSKLFRVLNAYIDQGVAIWQFPVSEGGLISSLRALERNSMVSMFNTPRPQMLLAQKKLSIKHLLHLVVGNEAFFDNYVVDQQFAHPGWSGMVSVLEQNQALLLDKRKISLNDLIIFELLLEIDALDQRFGMQWKPLGYNDSLTPIDLFEKPQKEVFNQLVEIWQVAFENTTYDQALSAIRNIAPKEPNIARDDFQALFCIDDRECSIRRYIENVALQQKIGCHTFGTPGHFGLEYYFQPENGKFHTKVCPAPVSPNILVQEKSSNIKRKKDFHFSKQTHGFLLSWLITHTVGLISSLRLIRSIFYPKNEAAANSSFHFMSEQSNLNYQFNPENPESADGLQLGFKVEQMADNVEKVLKSIGLVNNFAPVIYIIGHGASSVNNTYYAGYDCGACSGRPGSVNARLFAKMANRADVRQLLEKRNLFIPDDTVFIGGLHDTTIDEISFFETLSLAGQSVEQHERFSAIFKKALKLNAKERSRRFIGINTSKSLENIHGKIKKRAVAIFEPRPEWNHATNCFCIIGNRNLTHGLFLDRRAFLNSYDYKTDPDGLYLTNILNAAAPVCGGINLEYYFSRVDTQKLGAGTKLPHNVIGLNGVANGTDGDLRTGLPGQMIEMHDPLRLLMIVEHYSEVVLAAIKRNPATFEWFENNWVNLVVVNPETHQCQRFNGIFFEDYEPLISTTDKQLSLEQYIETSSDNLPIYLYN